MRKRALLAGAVLASAVSVVLPTSVGATGTVTGTITDGDGNPIAGAAVVALGSSVEKELTVTDAAGEYTLTLADDDYVITAQASGFAVGSSTAIVSGGGLTKDLTLTASGSKFESIGVFGGQISGIWNGGQPGVFFAATSVIPQLFRTADYGGTWAPVTMAVDDATNGLSRDQNIGRNNHVTTSGYPGEVAVLINGELKFTRDFGNTWKTVSGNFNNLGLGDQMSVNVLWAHVDTTSVLLLDSPNGIVRVDMSQTTPTFGSLEATGTGYRSNASDLIAVANGADTFPWVARLTSAGSLSLMLLDTSGPVTTVSTTTGLLSNATALKFGGSSVGTDPPSSVVVFGGGNVMIGAKATAASDFSGALSSATAANGGCGINGGAPAIGLAPNASSDGAAAAVSQCWFVYAGDGNALTQAQINGINNNTGYVFDAGWNGTSNKVALAGDGARGIIKSADQNGSSPFAPLFNAGQNAVAGTATNSGGIAVNGFNVAVVKDTAYGPDGASQFATITSPSGGALGIATDDAGATVKTVVNKGGYAVDWWTGTGANTWLVFGHAGAGPIVTAVNGWTSSTATLNNPNLGSATGANLMGGSPGNAAVNSIAGIPGADAAFVGMGNDDAGAIVRVSLSGTDTPSASIGTPTATANAVKGLAYCGSSGSDASVADTLFVATGTNSTGALQKVTGASTALSGITTVSGITTNKSLRDVAVDCATGRVYVIGEKVWSSTDGGATFSDVSPNNIPPAGMTAIGVNPADPDDIVVAAGAEGNIYASSNGGSSWTVQNDPHGSGRSFMSEGIQSVKIPPAALSSSPSSVRSAASVESGEALVGAGSGLFAADVRSSGAGDPSTSKFVPLSPQRILDTREGNGAVQAKLAPNGKIDLQVTGRGGVPSTGVSAVVLNVTATNSTGSGYVSVWPADQTQPTVSNLNVEADQTIPNLVTVGVSAQGKVSLFSYGGGDLIADVAGYYTPTAAATDGRLVSLTPQRILDTREGNGAPQQKVVADSSIDVQVTGRGGVPGTGVSAVVLNVTVTNAEGAGFVTAWASGQTKPTASNLNVERAGQTIPNQVIVPVGSNGKVSLYSWTTVDLLADVAGWFTNDTASSSASGLFVAVPPARFLDSRSGAKVVPEGTQAVQITGAHGVPSTGVGAIVANVTATESTGDGFVTVWGDGTRPNASNLNVVKDQTIPNHVTSPLTSTGKVNLFSYAGGHLLVDVGGYYTA
ncbi:MAG: beta strand repeat-containing protein [Acidimicrobiia bacterium]